MSTDKHIFALYYDALSSVSHNDSLIIKDKVLINRISNILRLGQGDKVILFDHTMHAIGILVVCEKKKIIIALDEYTAHHPLLPEIHWYLPLLERESWEKSLYALTAMGVTTITPVITEKSRRSWGSSKEHDRAQRLMIAAAEQSKQFCLPSIHTPQSLQESVEHINLFFDADGKHALTTMTQLAQNPTKPQQCLVGPEGDLTSAEKDMLREQGVSFCRLTPTVLRAWEAVTVSCGLMRSCLQQKV